MDGFKRPTRPARPSGSGGSITPRPDGISHQPPQQAPVQSAQIIRDHHTSTEQAARPLDMPTVQQPNPTEKPPATLGKKRRRWPWVLLGIVGLLAAVSIAANVWYQQQLQPVDPGNKATQDVQINKGVALSFVAGRLQERGLIRSSIAFQLYAQSVGKQGSLQAGTCRLMPSQSSAEILEQLTKGCNEFKVITFYPGGTIEQPHFKPVGSTIVHDKYVKLMLQKAGFSDSEIGEALAASYAGPLFAGKPAGTTLEGYVYGETYHVATKATAKEVLQVTFDEMYKVIEREELVAKYKALGLDLYQGITLASIVQKELNCEDKPTAERKATCYSYQQKIASVFVNRLKINMPLGSDSTFIYAADMTGQAATSRIDSLYNTYKHAGLPPGPIASPGALALKAAANPVETDYLYFVAGDDGLIYFSRTQAEHEANTAKYCHKLCAY